MGCPFRCLESGGLALAYASGRVMGYAPRTDGPFAHEGSMRDPYGFGLIALAAGGSAAQEIRDRQHARSYRVSSENSANVRLVSHLQLEASFA